MIIVFAGIHATEDPNICVDAKPVYYKSWMGRSILTFAYITKENGTLYKCDALMNKYKLQIRFKVYMSD